MKIRIALAAALLAGSTAFAADPAASNAERQTKLKALLVEKLGSDAGTINVTVVDDKVTLTGQVASRATQELSVEVVKWADERVKIDNQLKCTAEKSLVKGKTEDELLDTKLELAVGGKVKDEIGAHHKGVEVECTAGSCSVRGSVPDQARKDLALKTAAGVEGVKKVVDLLRVKP